MVGHGQIEPEQAQHAAAERLGLAQGEAEDEPQDERQFDRQVRVARLPARRGPTRCLPFVERRFVEPERQITAPAKPECGDVGVVLEDLLSATSAR